MNQEKEIGFFGALAFHVGCLLLAFGPLVLLAWAAIRLFSEK